MKKKTMATVLALVLILAVAVGGAVAWLIDTTTPVKNTFTVGDINITLKESAANYKMVPGKTIAKDPTVTVKANSEACWLFVKVEKSANFDDFLTYTMADDWTALEGVGGVYYRAVAATTADTAFTVLEDNQVTVKTDVTKAQLNALTDETLPTLTFTAYAVQQDNITTAAAAWNELNPTASGT